MLVPILHKMVVDLVTLWPRARNLTIIIFIAANYYEILVIITVFQELRKYELFLNQFTSGILFCGIIFSENFEKFLSH